MKYIKYCIILDKLKTPPGGGGSFDQSSARYKYETRYSSGNAPSSRALYDPIYTSTSQPRSSPLKGLSFFLSFGTWVTVTFFLRLSLALHVVVLCFAFVHVTIFVRSRTVSREKRVSLLSEKRLLNLSREDGRQSHELVAQKQKRK